MTNLILNVAFVGFCIVFAIFTIDRRRRNATPATRYPDLTRPRGDTGADLVESSDNPSPWTALDDSQLARLLRDSCP